MSTRKALIPVLVCVLLNCACGYIVLPEDVGGPSAGSEGWSAVATNISTADTGDLHIDIALQNKTGDWSAMQAAEGEPAVLRVGDKTTNCDTVFVSSGGHRLAPGFQMRGFIGGTKAEPVTQLIYVECAGAEVASEAKLSINYVYFTGQYNYY